jgi:hypothetical protein
MGAGEGNQAFGHGLYFAEHEPVSEWYRHQLAARRDPILSKYGLDSEDGAQIGIQLSHRGGDVAGFIKDLKVARDSNPGGLSGAALRNSIKRTEGKIAYLQDPARNPGHLYEVAIDHPPEQFLDWDKAPRTDQLEAVQKAAEEIKPGFYDRLMGQGKDLAKWALTHPDAVPPRTGESVYSALRRGLGDDAKASTALKKAGIPGIRYLDQLSRADGGTHNYVTFSAPRLLKKYGVPGLIGAGGFGSLARPEEK